MDEHLRLWIAHIKEVRPKMDILAQELRKFGAIVTPEKRSTVNELPYVAKFQYPNIVVTICFLLQDQQTPSDVVITNITVFPIPNRREGYGTLSLQRIVAWASANNLNEIRATQINGPENESFWKKNGFHQCPPPNPCNDFLCSLQHT